ncbi:MAG TPA: oxidoreductase [Chloroflexia bacterium]|nr:oxidoreductase [Chloroflexia bacterium]
MSTPEPATKAKPKVAFYWCASCGGCEEAVVDLAEGILDVVEAVDIVFWPVALDFKRSHVEQMADKEIFVSFINGAIRLSEQEEMAKLLRRKSQVVVAYGACSHLGGIPGLANLVRREDILEYVYHQAPTIEEANGIEPQEETEVQEGVLDLPRFYSSVRTLDQVIDVDYYLPGCPPTPGLTLQAIQTLLSGVLPGKGSVLAGSRALCYECPLNATKPEKLLLKGLKRTYEVSPDPAQCLLTQGIMCLGPVTRGGCEALCINGHMPCTGCFGPLDRVHDYGGKAASAIASILDFNEPEDVSAAVAQVADPAGTFYRYSLPGSLLGQFMRETAGE